MAGHLTGDKPSPSAYQGCIYQGPQWGWNAWKVTELKKNDNPGMKKILEFNHYCIKSSESLVSLVQNVA